MTLDPLEAADLVDTLQEAGHPTEALITQLYLEGRNFHAIARALSVNWRRFREEVLPRWKALCRFYLGED